MAYTKLAQSILTSTIWMEDDKTRIVWMTLLAMADQNGEVQASIPGLAHIARVSTESCREAIEKFLSPDPDSRTKDDEGRRIEEMRGGWLLINHGHYRDLSSNEDQKRKAAERQQRWRDKMKRNAPVTQRNAPVTQSNTASRPIPHTDTEADTEADTKKTPKKTRVPKTQSVPMAEFDEFWKAYPRKVARGSAEKAWRTATKLVSAQTIIDAAKRFSSVAGKGEKTFLKHPATWLNDQCWLDELPEPAEKVCRWPYDDTDIHTPEGMALLTKTFLENQHRD